MQDVTLDALGLAAGTDKASRGHGYLARYEELFRPWEDEAFDLLEIGVRFGRSIRVWHAWFPAARIVGVDLQAITLEDEARLPRYVFRQGNQADPAFLGAVLDEFDPRIVIDDGSHVCWHQILTFKTNFPRLKPGSIYICEDIQTSFMDEHGPYRRDSPETAADYFFRLARHVAGGPGLCPAPADDPGLRRMVAAIRSIEIIPHCAIIRS
ncbi:MAG: hypothetical protein ACKOWF_14625 [Chloroflexota bacterium]